MKHRNDDLIGIRKARFASFVLLLVCFAALLVIFSLVRERQLAYFASFCVIAVLLIFWWIIYRRILYEEASFFEALASDMRSVHHRLRMLDAAVRQIGDGVIIVADDGDFVMVNETAKRLLAAFDSELSGVKYDEYAAGFSEKLERASILAAARDSSPSEIIVIDGQSYKLRFVALAAEHGKERGAVAVISDVTESAKAERMQIDFVSNVSHELKTPLASIKGYTETLMDGASGDPDTEQEFFKIIVSEVNRMDRLIKGLLLLTKIESAEPTPAASENDLTALVRMSVKQLAKLAEKKSLSLNLMFGETRPIMVEIDRDRMNQVFLNLIENAIKYTEEKGRIDVDIISGQNCVQIVISDNGIGIPEKDLPRVFERFFRVDEARTGKIGGTGLGLAISKQIVDAHGGSISVESKLGRGTTVTVSLPTGKSRGTPGIL